MSALLLIADLFIVFLLTLYLLNKYGDWRKQRLVVTIATFVGWYFSFIILFVLPLDVTITFYNRCMSEHADTNSTVLCEKPQGYVPDNILLGLWRIVYWTAQCLTWLILPLLQSYSIAGEFTASERFKAALRNNAIYYGIYALICTMILIYAIFKGVVINMESLKVILVSASNSWGLFLLVLLLGYGLVELPRSLWYKGSRNYRLNKTYFNIDKLSTSKCDTEDNVKQLYRESRRVSNALRNDPRRSELAQIILDKFPQEVIDELFPARSATDFSGAADADLFNTDKYLISHHKYVISAVQSHHRTSAQWRALVNKALFLEDVAQAESTGRLTSSSSLLPQSFYAFWHIRCQKVVCKILALLLTVMTIFILFSECTFFIIHPTLSPAALLMEYAAQRFHYKYTQIVAMGIIWYLCASAYFTVFRLKIYKYYHLDSHKHTDENSLLFSAILMCRLTPPICLNFLGMVHLDSHITMIKDYAVETQFTKLMGHLDVIPILAKGINIYLPICILIFCAVNYYKLGSRLLHLIGIDQFIADDEFTQDMVNSGRALVQVERNSLNRKVKRERRGENFTNNVRGSGSQCERIPIIEAEEGTRLGYGQSSSLIEVPAVPFERSPRRDHPSPTNLFDDM